jgi:hypothetical protein
VFPVHMRSPYIFVPGFAQQHSIELPPPRGATVAKFEWPAYLTQTSSLAAFADLFEPDDCGAHDRNPFKVVFIVFFLNLFIYLFL